ncbi:MAG: hypothetical protein QM765_40325 [Myxococcales bacterium]
MTPSILSVATLLGSTLAAAPAQAEMSRLSMYLPPSLVILVGLALLVRELNKGLAPQEPAAAAAVAASAPGQAPAADEVPVAVIAAAVAAVVDQPHRVVSVSLATRQSAWSIEGRRQLLTSHQIRR